jgi:hypothetical protein
MVMYESVHGEPQYFRFPPGVHRPPAIPEPCEPAARRARGPISPQPLELELDLLWLRQWLTARQVLVLVRYYGLLGRRHQTLREIADWMGVRPSTVANVKAAAIARLRKDPHAVIQAGLECGLWDRHGRQEDLVEDFWPGMPSVAAPAGRTAP